MKVQGFPFVPDNFIKTYFSTKIVNIIAPSGAYRKGCVYQQLQEPTLTLFIVY